MFLFHKSEKYYVSCALRAAKAHNKDVTIITDVTSKMYSDYAKVEDFSVYKNESDARFEEVYSDLLLYGNITEVISKYYDSYDVCSCISEQNYVDFY